MKYSFKYNCQIFWWRIFSRWRYRIAKQFMKAFDNMDKDVKAKLAKDIWDAVTSNL